MSIAHVHPGATEPPTAGSRPSRRSRVGRVATVAWLLALGGALTALARYHGAPGDPGRTPATWPADEPRRAPEGLEVVLAVHPRCPCTVPAVDALADVLGHLRRSGRPLAVRVLVRMPEAGPDDAWREGPAARRLSALGERTERLDPGGRLAARWGMTTSGHVAVFDPDGRRLLDGGLTPARGHAEDPAVLRAIAGRLAEDRPVVSRPVFGCPVPDPEDRSPATVVREPAAASTPSTPSTSPSGRPGTAASPAPAPIDSNHLDHPSHRDRPDRPDHRTPEDPS